MRIENDFRDLIPSLSSEEYRKLEESLLTEGCRDPIILWNDIIIDGHHRYTICTKYSLPFETKSMDFDSRQAAMAWMIDNQLSRRNLSTVDKIILARKKTAILEKAARENQRIGGRLKSDLHPGGSPASFDNIVERSSNDGFDAINIRKETAILSGVSEGTVAKVLRLQSEHPDLLDGIRRGDLSINRAYKSAYPHHVYASGDNEWYTQPVYIEMARNVMGSIDTDPATCSYAQEWIQAGTYYTAENTGLDKSWYGNIWLNPPYAAPLLTRFIDKLFLEIETGNVSQAIVLVNNATETRWFSRLVRSASALCFTHGRLKFVKSLSDAPHAPMQGQVFVYFGEKCEKFASEFSRIGSVVVPYNIYVKSTKINL